MAENKIVIELTPEEAEILIGAIAHVVPADRSHEVIIVSLYIRIKSALEKFMTSG